MGLQSTVGAALCPLLLAGLEARAPHRSVLPSPAFQGDPGAQLLHPSPASSSKPPPLPKCFNWPQAPVGFALQSLVPAASYMRWYW
jgi:hypothetical protein